MLWFWVVVLVVLIGAISIVASGRGDSMVEVYEDRPDVSLPAGRPLTADDLHSVQLNTGVRGYRMDEVDDLLARLEAEMLEREDHADVQVVQPRSELTPDLEAAPEEDASVADEGEPADEEPLEDAPYEDAPGGEHRNP